MSDLPPTLQYKSPAHAAISKERNNAARSLRALGVFRFLVSALCMFSAAVFAFRSAGALASGVVAIVLAATAATALILLGLGCTYWICAIKIKQFNQSAALVALVVASIQLALALLSLVGSMVQFAQGLTNAIPAILALLFIAGLIQLIGQLVKVRREVI